MWRALIPVCMFLADPGVAGAADRFMPGPVQARVVRVLDGDTFEAEAFVWPGHSVRVKVRIRGIDAPETRSRCLAEKEAGLAARAVLRDPLGDAPVSVINIGDDKYYGRVLADVETAEGVRVAERLLEMQVVRAYSGGRRESACTR